MSYSIFYFLLLIFHFVLFKLGVFSIEEAIYLITGSGIYGVLATLEEGE